MSHLGFISAGHYEELERCENEILSLNYEGGKELPSSSALDSPSVLSKLATPKPASATRSDMSHVIDDATSAMMILMKKLLPCLILLCHLVNFLMNNLLGLERVKIFNLIILMKVMMKTLPLINMNRLLFLRVMFWKKKLL